MRCPKCHYISFDSNDRCRNCGYEFSMAAAVELQPLDLPIHSGEEAIGPLSDFSLSDLDTRRGNTPEPPLRSPDPLPVRRPRAAEPQPRPLAGTGELPLFKDRRIDDDAPLVTPPAVPRAPLAVRRSTPIVTRGSSRAAADEPVLELEATEPFERIARFAPQLPASGDPANRDAAPADATASATAGPRLLAALIDVVIISAVAAVVLYFTLKVCRLQFSELTLLPAMPFVAFLSLLAGGYVILFTVAGGQTVGKMAAGIKVVALEGEGHWRGRVPLGRAVLRAAGYLVSGLPVGLGFLPALFGADRRAVHDRLADTRVVKA